MDFIAQGILEAFRLLWLGDPQTWSAVRTTVAVSSLSIACSLLLGAPLGFALGYYEFPGKRVTRLLVDTLLSLPTVVIGLLVYAFISRQGPLGSWNLLFSIQGVAVGQTLLGLPIVMAMTATAVEGQDRRLRQTLLTLGASPFQVLLTTLVEARFAVALAAMAAYGRIVSEVGISMMVGGNIKWHTRTITTAIALETGKGEFGMGVALGLVLMLIALLVNLLAAGVRRTARQ
ncbi:tungstate transport system permease protein [Paucidesulfovibrio gracilis DSM 16080]|uniref:Tungstate transport system permease protein n=1 Tax=Paucidesulfovibrio gracilis DSM 16080 TaxID=1121449 RepID=A0A1T4WI59_9BACT|nr:ABC transporter permease [Paucidesulfovibrio gracilis]SKA76849.1 tungstate transport system permease protein [Paucidesulfovibrio gracilis DSM 16080]